MKFDINVTSQKWTLHHRTWWSENL